MIDDENSILTDFLKFVRSMRVVNGIGTMTFLGGNTVSDEIIESMKYVSDIFINMQDFSRIAGEYIARRLGVEAAYITAGAAAGTVLGLASLLSLKTGQDTSKTSLRRAGRWWWPSRGLTRQSSGI